MSNNKIFQEMLELRKDDVFSDKSIESMLIDKVYPRTTSELALKLSNITAGFFGYTLKQVGEHCGKDKIDAVSSSLFKELGMLKTQEAKSMGIDVPNDTRAMALAIISAIYTSSPEYKFEIKVYESERTEMRLFGACRYYRIAKKLNIADYISPPILKPFFDGVAEYLGIKCNIDMKINSLDQDGTCDYYLNVSM
jgi:hypothetical protein